MWCDRRLPEVFIVLKLDDDGSVVSWTGVLGAFYT